MGGRRASYNVRLAKRLCEHIALGSTLKQALEKEPMAPVITTFWRWLDEYPEFAEMYERARQLQADLMSDTIMTMAEQVLKQPKYAAAFKVASDILKWQAEVKNPRYRTKTEIEHKVTLSPVQMQREIAQLEKELGLIELADPNVIDMEVKE